MQPQKAASRIGIPMYDSQPPSLLEPLLLSLSLSSSARTELTFTGNFYNTQPVVVVGSTRNMPPTPCRSRVQPRLDLEPAGTYGCMRRLCYVAQPSAGHCNETPTSVSVDTTGLAIHESTAEE